MYYLQGSKPDQSYVRIGLSYILVTPPGERISLLFLRLNFAQRFLDHTFVKIDLAQSYCCGFVLQFSC